MLGLLGLTTFLFLGQPVVLALPTATTSATSTPKHSKSLAHYALEKVLSDASPVFGNYDDEAVNETTKGSSNTSRWMKQYSDDTLLVHMNIPGTHDAATWNYSQATQSALSHVTNLVMDVEFNPAAYRCQNRSMADALNAGIRVFDLRYAYDVTNSTLVFWHGTALQSETSTVDDVLFGFYKWLDDHPSEVLFLSFQYEGTTSRYSSNDAGVQLLLYNALTSRVARRYFLQTKGSLGTLGESRGKIILLRRFDLDLLPSPYESNLPGLHFSPTNWTDNGANITLQYSPNGTAYIEDYYAPQTPSGASAEESIRYKFNATEAHLQMAATTHPDSLFWSFASSTNLLDYMTPELQAIGNGTNTPKGGVNQQLVPVFEGLRGKRLGIVMFDFYETPTNLVPTFLSLLQPLAAKSYPS